MSLKGFSRSPIPHFMLAALSAVCVPQASASDCKGLDEVACKESSSCSWISSYTTKNGNTVAAYCRSAGGKARQDQNSRRGEQNKPSNTDARAPIDTGMTEEKNG